jgi:hypothetical protein
MIFALLTLLTALGLATVAGWFSIIGVMAIYAGAPYHALIMGIILELGKLVTTSWLYRNWTFSDWKFKAPLIGFTIALMLATSIGVFGFLSKSHLEQGAKTIDNAPKVERIEQQIAREKAIIIDNEKVIAQLDATINSYLGKDRTDKSVSIRRSQAPQRKELKDEIDVANKHIDGFNDEKFKLQSEIRALELEVGPIRYIAELMYGAENNNTKNIEGAVKIFTLLIVSILDPLAIILLVAANHSIMRRQDEKKQENDKKGPAGERGKLPPEPSPDSSIQISGTNFAEPDTRLPDKIFNESHEKATIHVPISTESLEIISETPKDTIIEGTPGKEILQEGAGGTNESPTDIMCDILAQESDTEGKNETTEEVSLREFLPAKGYHPLPIIRSPNPTRVTKITAIELPINKIQDPNQEERAQQNPIIREIIGNNIHFIPQKINEEENLTSVEVSTKVPSASNPSTPGVEEIQQGRQGENESLRGVQKSHVSDVPTHSHDKYPKALSWLTEFKRI